MLLRGLNLLSITGSMYLLLDFILLWRFAGLLAMFLRFLLVQILCFGPSCSCSDVALAKTGAALNALSLVNAPQAWLEDPAGPDSLLSHPSFLGSPLPGRYPMEAASPRSPLPGADQAVSHPGLT
jgi:hypothetical protein